MQRAIVRNTGENEHRMDWWDTHSATLSRCCMPSTLPLAACQIAACFCHSTFKYLLLVLQVGRLGIGICNHVSRRLCIAPTPLPSLSSLAPHCPQVGRLGIGICYDIRFPEMAQLYAARGVQLIVYPGECGCQPVRLPLQRDV